MGESMNDESTHPKRRVVPLSCEPWRDAIGQGSGGSAPDIADPKTGGRYTGKLHSNENVADVEEDGDTNASS